MQPDSYPEKQTQHIVDNEPDDLHADAANQKMSAAEGTPKSLFLEQSVKPPWAIVLLPPRRLPWLNSGPIFSVTNWSQVCRSHGLGMLPR
jgi:hypothetical protein